MVRVVAHVTARPGHEAQLERILFGLLAPTRAEHGCIDYDVHVGDDPQVYTFIESWQDDDALDMHLGSEHLQEAMVAIVPHVIGAPNIRRFIRIDR